MGGSSLVACFFFFNDTATTEIYTLSLHDALPISNDELLEKLKSNMQEVRARGGVLYVLADAKTNIESSEGMHVDRKSTRLNSSHTVISYAVFCLKKKKKRAD